MAASNTSNHAALDVEEVSHNTGDGGGSVSPNKHDWKMALPCAVFNIMAGCMAARYNHPKGDEPAYLLAIGSVLVAGVAEVLAALWVSRDANIRGATGQKVLYASLVTLLLSFALNVFAYSLKK